MRDELKARQWTQVEFAKVIRRPQRLISEIINARRRVTAQTAHELGAAFGTSAEYWMNLEVAWQLAQVRIDKKAIQKRARMLEQKGAQS